MKRDPFLLLLETAAALGVVALGYWLGWRRGSAIELEFIAAPALAEGALPAPPSLSSPSANPATEAPPLTLEEAWKDIIPALEKAVASEDDERIEELMRRLQARSTTDLAELLKRMNEEGKGGGKSDSVWNILVNVFSARDPAAAFALAVAPFPPEKVPGQAILVFERWGERDPSVAWHAAMAWMGKPESDPRLPRRSQPMEVVLVPSFFQRWATKDFDAAYQAWRETTEPSLRGEALRGLSFSAKTEAEHARLFERLLAEPPGADTTKDLAVALERWSKASSLDTVSKRLDVIDLPREDMAALDRAAAFGAAPADPPAAIAWLAARNAPERRAEDTATMVRTWSQSAPNACGEWLAQQTPGPDIDPAIAKFANEIASIDPESALAWSQRITDPKTRSDAAKLAFLQWHDRSPAEALAKAQTLPPNERDWLEPFLKK